MQLNNAVELFSEYVDNLDFSPNTIQRYNKDLNAFNLYLEQKYNGQVFLEDITVSDIEMFMASLKKHYAPISRSRYLYTLRSFYKFAHKKELVEKNLALSLEPGKLPVKERHYLTEEEIEKLVEAIDHALISLVVVFLANTGLRISECLNLTLEDVDLDAKLIRVKNGKGNKDRNVPISKKLHPLIQDYRDNWRDAYGSERFFATKKTGKLTNTYINTVLRDTVKKLGWKKKVSCHILRHSFASNLIKKKVGIVEVQKLLGHSSLKTTSVYTHVDNEQLYEAVNVL